MMHSDPDTLAAVAMGETDVSADDMRHIDSCAECSREIRSLHRVTELGRSGAPEQPLLTPSPAVWARISSTLGIADDVAPNSLPAVAPTPQQRTRSEVRGSRRRRSRRWVLPVAIAASVAVIAGAAAVTVSGLSQRSAATLLANVTLEPLPEWPDASGGARIEQMSDGERDVVVTLEASAPASASEYREVWLISTDLTKLVSVGVISGETGTFAIPDGVDLRDYPIVDISSESLDGDPGHSGDSIVRGEIRA